MRVARCYPRHLWPALSITKWILRGEDLVNGRPAFSFREVSFTSHGAVICKSFGRYYQRHDSVAQGHFVCGGIKVDNTVKQYQPFVSWRNSRYRTSCANRLASNHGSKASFSRQSARHKKKDFRPISYPEHTQWTMKATHIPRKWCSLPKLQRNAANNDNYVGIVRSNLRLKRAWTDCKLFMTKPRNWIENRPFRENCWNCETW
jgi:aspartate oxidase